MLSSTTKTLVLTAANVNTIVCRTGHNRLMDMLIETLETKVADLDYGKIDIPARSGFNYQNNDPGLIEWMPVYTKDHEVVIKVVGYHPNNPEKYKLPTILSTISSYDTKNGHLKGIIDGVLPTALRTGAASAIASKHMAPANSRTLGLIGCGAQSVTQLHAISRVFPIEKVLIFDTDKTAENSFKDRISMLDLNINVIPKAMEAIVNESDILSTATSVAIGKGPLFDEFKVKPNLHINAVGSDFPGKIELPKALLLQSVVVPDFLEQAKLEGECQQLEDTAIGPDLVSLIKNKSQYTTIKDTMTVFDSTGWALEDEVTMNVFLQLAKEFGVGTEMAIENVTKDVKNPYHFLLKSVPV